MFILLATISFIAFFAISRAWYMLLSMHFKLSDNINLTTTENGWSAHASLKSSLIKTKKAELIRVNIISFSLIFFTIAIWQMLG